ncbi:MAG: ATP-binding protein [Clostridiales bacterium]|nr:ATP-binding protein [Clostridiales bacterium]
MNFVIEDYNALKDALHIMCLQLEERSVPQETVFHSKLVADELLSNALQHGGGSARFWVEFDGNEITLSVKGAKSFRPPETSACSPVEAECGRGLFLVDNFGIRGYSEERGITVVIKIG